MANARVLWQAISLFLLAGMLVGCESIPDATAPKQAAEQREVSSTEATPKAETAARETRKDENPTVVNILLLGVDSWDTLSGRSDAIVVVSVDVEHRRVLLTSVPRDLRVSLDGHVQPQRINAAYAYGGAELARSTLEQVLAIEIPYHAVVNFAGFARIIDTLGGVTVEVPSDIIDLDFPAADGVNYEPFVLLAGVHHLDGETALKYARTRKSSPNGDFSRMDRQHQVMRALKAQALTPRTLLRIPALFREFRNAVDTNVTLDMAVRLARVATGVAGGDVHAYAIDESSGLVTSQVIDGVFVLEPDLAGIRLAVSERIAALAEEIPHVAGSTGS